MGQEHTNNKTAGVGITSATRRMMMKRLLTSILSVGLMLSLCTWAGAAETTELQAAAAFVAEQGIMVGDTSGNQQLDRGLNRAELAAILTRMCVNPEHVAYEQDYYTRQCKFTDVPDWAKLSVGVCVANSLMQGYGDGRFGAADDVTPAAAATVMLRYVEYFDKPWDYATACATAQELGLLPAETAGRTEVTRGDMAILIYRAMGNRFTGESQVDQADPEETSDPVNATLSKNADGSINPPADGSQYVPQVGDMIRCDDGTNYTITDVSRWDKSMFASGPLPPLPAPTCDWSQFPKSVLPEVRVNHFVDDNSDELFILNLYETRRMEYTLYNLIGSNSETWENGAPKLNYAKTGPLVNVYLTLDETWTHDSFWPWKESNISNLFNSRPVSQYHVQAWDHFNNGKFLETQYLIQSF